VDVLVNGVLGQTSGYSLFEPCRDEGSESIVNVIQIHTRQSECVDGSSALLQKGEGETHRQSLLL